MHSASAAHKPTLGPFSLISRIRKPSINPGEAIEIEVFITGTGNSPTDIKLNLSNPASILKVDKEGNVGYTETSIIIQKDKDNKITGIAMGNDEIIFTKAGELIPVIRKSPIYFISLL